MNHLELFRAIVAREAETSWTELEEVQRAIASDAEMNRRMREEWARIPELTQPEICKYYARSKTWLMQTYGNSHKAVLGLARRDKEALPSWAAEFVKYLPTRATILDFGGGFLRDSWFFVPHGHRVVLAEVDGPVIRIMQSFLHAIEEPDVVPLPVRDERPPLETYDGVISFETLEHVKNPVALTERLAATLPKGGPFVMSVSFGAPDHAPYHLAENARFSDPSLWSAELRRMGLELAWNDGVSTIELWRKT